MERAASGDHGGDMERQPATIEDRLVAYCRYLKGIKAQIRVMQATLYAIEEEVDAALAALN